MLNITAKIETARITATQTITIAAMAPPVKPLPESFLFPNELNGIKIETGSLLFPSFVKITNCLFSLFCKTPAVLFKLALIDSFGVQVNS